MPEIPITSRQPAPVGTSADAAPQSWARSFTRDMLVTVILMVAFSGLLYLLTGNFLIQLRYSLTIGICTRLASDVIMKLRGTRKPDWKTLAGAIIFGMFPGVFIATLLNGWDPFEMHSRYLSVLLTVLAIALFCTLTISYFFHSRTVISETTAALRQKELERISAEQRLTEANLRMLQAQIEPHFLFNTLSNIQSLIGCNPDKAEQMLGNFTDYLRASLQQTRTDLIELRGELATVRSFLEIMAVRMGNRLTSHIEAAPELHGIMVPPLILQPLVENAVEHGIDPIPEGGTVTVRAARDGDALVLEVCDNGVGISSSNPMGVGLANIRERLRLLYGERAALQVKVAVPRGTLVRVTIPLETGGIND